MITVDPEIRELKWDRRFLEAATLFSTWSKDRSTKVGCVIVSPQYDIVATGYNGFPRGIDDDLDERHERPTKYLFAEHSERNAIYAAARMGHSLVGCTLYTVALPSNLGVCADCARAIIQSGICTVVQPPTDYNNPRWSESCNVGRDMMLEAGIELRHVVGAA